jgi:hypothetical protein
MIAANQRIQQVLGRRQHFGGRLHDLRDRLRTHYVAAFS